MDETLVYKKVDSTLRGNLTSEIRALNDFYNPDLMVFAPAFPKQGRKTVDGTHRLDGTPIHRTQFGEDIKSPVQSSTIPSYFHDFVIISICPPEKLKDTRIENLVRDFALVSFDVREVEELGNMVKKCLPRYYGRLQGNLDRIR